MTVPTPHVEQVVFDGSLTVSRFRLLDVTWPATGPCGRCRAPCTRYGEDGAVLCAGCAAGGCHG